MVLDISTEICKVKLKNPTILASGILGVSGSSLVNVAANGAGAVTTKSISIEPRKGHPCPAIITYESGMLNAVGLSNAGINESIAEIEYAKKHSGVPVIASIFASTIKEFGKTARMISKAKPDLIEVNISCPNVEAEFGMPFSTDPKAAADVAKEVKKNTSLPVIIKLSPNVPNIKEIAKAVVKAGADCINAINTVGPGMAISIKAKKPILSNKTGGVSGPAIKPIALRCVYDIYSMLKEMKRNKRIPIVGTGGVTYGKDAVEFFMAGASAVGIGTAAYYRGIDVFRKVCTEIELIMKEENFSSIDEVKGIAHE
ncbi:MAG: dihydroorotate dehydrogenase [Candidatus Woesearchaeota archaeon]|nr:dihydroorotate dehydrogenase [Candidatus Woesearchaeota archaeon]